MSEQSPFFILEKVGDVAVDFIKRHKRRVTVAHINHGEWVAAVAATNALIKAGAVEAYTAGGSVMVYPNTRTAPGSVDIIDSKEIA